MAKYSVTIEWDDSPDKIESGPYLFEVLSVHPFKNDKSSGWEIVLKPEREPQKRIKDWLTVNVSDKSQAWRLDKLKKFLEATGLTKATKDITHHDLIGLKVSAFVKRGPVKVRGVERIESRIGYYLNEDITDANDVSEVETQRDDEGDLDEII